MSDNSKENSERRSPTLQYLDLLQVLSLPALREAMRVYVEILMESMASYRRGTVISLAPEMLLRFAEEIGRIQYSSSQVPVILTMLFLSN